MNMQTSFLIKFAEDDSALKTSYLELQVADNFCSPSFQRKTMIFALLHKMKILRYSNITSFFFLNV